MNQIIIDALEVLRKRDVANKETFSARAYAKVISQLHDKTINTYEDLQDVKGIGKKIEKKIKEILETGTLKAAEKAKEAYNIDALDALQRIYGVGPAKASDLVKQGITSIEQLRENQHLLNDKQKIGLKYYEDLLERIPREEMEYHRTLLEKVIPEMEIVGSYRRGSETSGDIDVLIKGDLNLYVNLLQECGYIIEILALGPHKCMAISQVNGKARRLDLLVTPDEEYAYAMLYFTGSDKFNVAFRQHALTMGYTLNEHRLESVSKAQSKESKVPYMKTEKDIFKFVGLRYIEPSKRINQIVKIKSKPKVASE